MLDLDAYTIYNFFLQGIYLLYCEKGVVQMVYVYKCMSYLSPLKCTVQWLCAAYSICTPVNCVWDMFALLADAHSHNTHTHTNIKSWTSSDLVRLFFFCLCRFVIFIQLMLCSSQRHLMWVLCFQSVELSHLLRHLRRSAIPSERKTFFDFVICWRGIPSATA